MADAKKLLEDYGLSGNEAQVYLVSLKLGTARVFEIAKAARLPESTTRDNLNVLLKHGLILKSSKGEFSLFGAAHPQKLISILDRKIQGVKKSLSPKIKDLQKMAAKK